MRRDAMPRSAELVTTAALLVAASGALSAQAGERAASDDTTSGRPGVRAPDPGSWVRIGEPVPNPFRDTVRIPFRIGEGAFDPDSGIATGPAGEGWVAVTVTIYNLLHQRVGWAGMVEGETVGTRRLRELPVSAPGVYRGRWDGRDSTGVRLPAGPYFAVLEVGGDVHVRKLLRLPPR